MKKFFALVAVVMACATLSAEVLFEESFATRRGSTYIDKVDLGEGKNPAWPFASQWFDGYTGTQGAVEGNQFDNDYTSVTSYSVSVRGKKLNGESTNTVGLFFMASKTAEQDFVKFEGALPTVAEGDLLKFEICSSETDGGDLDLMIVKVNGEALTVPATQLGAKCVTSIVEIALPEGEISSIEFAFDNVPAQKFISRFWIEEAPAEGIENIMLTEKAHKMVVDGVVYIVRDGKMFNLTGTQVR